MKKHFVLALLTVGMAFTVPATQAVAADAPNDKPAQAPPKTAKQKQMPFRGKVGAVDKVAKTVTLEGKEKSRTFQITSASKITKNGKPAVIDDVTVGETVGGLAREVTGKLEIVTLNLGAKAAKPKEGGKKGETK
jgi:hypothetical protein